MIVKVWPVEHIHFGESGDPFSTDKRFSPGNRLKGVGEEVACALLASPEFEVVGPSGFSLGTCAALMAVVDG